MPMDASRTSAYSRATTYLVSRLVRRPAYGPRRRDARTRRRADRVRGVLSLVIALAIIVAAWAAAAWRLSDHLLPSPATVMGTFSELIADGSLQHHTLVSLARVFSGFVLAVVVALPLGFALGWYRTARDVGEPIVQFFRVIPPIALIPLVILYLGIGEDAKVFLIWLASFLVVIAAVSGGVRAVDGTLIRAARVLGAKDSDIFLDIVVPATLPYTLVGMRLGLAAAWSTLVAAELIAASAGLGYMIVQAGTYRQVPVIIVGVVTIGVIGVLMDRGLLWLERVLCGWQERERT